MKDKNFIPILNYHGIDGEPFRYEWERPEKPYLVSAETFAGQLDYLASLKYAALNLSGLEDFDARGIQSATVMITFDDGHLSHSEIAAPLLKERGMPALFFIPGALVGKRGHMDWPALKALTAQGFEIGAHGWNHIPLTGLDEKALRNEFERPKKTLEDKLGVAVKSFSIPRGFSNPAFIAFAKEIGYRYLFTSQYDVQRQGSGLYQIKRMAVLKATRQQEFSRMISGRLGMKRIVEQTKETARRMLPPAFYDTLAGIKQGVMH